MNRIKHFGLVVSLIGALCFAGSAFAVPVKPDLDKILKQQEQHNRQFEPAQAGWNGPEMQRGEDGSHNAVLEAYGPAATVRSVRAALVAAAVPDPKAVVAIAILILLMRIMRQLQERERKQASVIAISSTASAEESKAA